MALDKNKDGIITFKELKDGAQLFGWNPTGNDISRYLTKMDRDGMFLTLICPVIKSDRNSIKGQTINMRTQNVQGKVSFRRLQKREI